MQEDLVEALQNGTIFSAGLDVMVPEPLPADDALTKLPNCGEASFDELFRFHLLSEFFGVFVHSHCLSFGIGNSQDQRRYGCCGCSKCFKWYRRKTPHLFRLLMNSGIIVWFIVWDIRYSKKKNTIHKYLIEMEKKIKGFIVTRLTCPRLFLREVLLFYYYFSSEYVFFPIDFIITSIDDRRYFFHRFQSLRIS